MASRPSPRAARACARSDSRTTVTDNPALSAKPRSSASRDVELATTPTVWLLVVTVWIVGMTTAAATAAKRMSVTTRKSRPRTRSRISRPATRPVSPSSFRPRSRAGTTPVGNQLLSTLAAQAETNDGEHHADGDDDGEGVHWPTASRNTSERRRRSKTNSMTWPAARAASKTTSLSVASSRTSRTSPPSTSETVTPGITRAHAP